MEKKYGLLRNGYPPNKSSATWRGILSVKKLLMENIKYQTGMGEIFLFWKDQWAGDRTVAAQFPDLFNCAMDKDAKVKSYMSRRHLKDQEESQFISLLNLLNDMYIPESREDTKVWTASKDGSFSVSSSLPLPMVRRRRMWLTAFAR